MPQQKLRFETLQVHAGNDAAAARRAAAPPIFQTTSFTFDDCAHGAGLFALDAAVTGPVVPREPGLGTQPRTPNSAAASGSVRRPSRVAAAKATTSAPDSSAAVDSPRNSSASRASASSSGE